jgi:hypothetical protein
VVEELAWSVDDRDDVTLMAVRGGLTLRSATDLGAALRKSVLDRGQVIVDATDVRVLSAASVAVFPTVLAQSGGWPSARLVIIDASGSVGNELRAVRAVLDVPVVRDRSAALPALAQRPERVRRATDLPDGVAGPRFARALVRDACADWGADVVADRCVVVSNELAANAVQHARGEPTLFLSSYGGTMTIAVKDASPVLPPTVLGRRPSGLQVVQELSVSWGVRRDEVGKTVWAKVRVADH